MRDPVSHSPAPGLCFSCCSLNKQHCYCRWVQRKVRTTPCPEQDSTLMEQTGQSTELRHSHIRAKLEVHGYRSRCWVQIQIQFQIQFWIYRNAFCQGSLPKDSFKGVAQYQPERKETERKPTSGIFSMGRGFKPQVFCVQRKALAPTHLLIFCCLSFPPPSHSQGSSYTSCSVCSKHHFTFLCFSQCGYPFLQSLPAAYMW